MIEAEPQQNKKIRDISLPELVGHLEQLWERVIQKQLRELHPNQANLIELETFLIGKLNSIEICIDNNLKPYFQKALISDPEIQNTIAQEIRKSGNVCYVNEDFPDVVMISLPTHRDAFGLLHELAHALDYFMGTQTKDTERAKTNQRIAKLNLIISKAFVGISASTFLLSSEILKVEPSILLNGIVSGGVTLAGFSALRSAWYYHQYNQTTQEAKANRFATEIQEETINPSQHHAVDKLLVPIT